MANAASVQLHGVFNSSHPPPGDTPMCATLSNKTTESCCNSMSNTALYKGYYNAATGYQGLCLLGDRNVTGFTECVARSGTNQTECKGYDERVAELQRDVPNRPFPIYTVSGMGSSAPISEDNRVVYSSIQEDLALISECCEMAQNTSFWWRHADTSDPANGQACVFHKDEAEKKNIYDIFWKPCIENGGGYPVQLNKVTGTGAGYANSASIGVIIAAAALAMLA